MKLLRRNNLERSKKIGLIAFGLTVLLLVLFFNDIKVKKSSSSVNTNIELAKSNKP